MSKQGIPKIYTLEDIQKVTDGPEFRMDLIDGIRDGFVAMEKGEFYAAPIQTLGLPPFPFVSNVDGYAAQTCVKSGYFKGQEHYVIKVASGGHPMENGGLMQVYSQKTGRLEELLLDEGVLTELRTAAVGALAARLLAPKDIQTIGILGTGVQARYQLAMLPAVTGCTNVLVWGRSTSKVIGLIEEMNSKGWHLSAAGTPDQLLEECDLIVTTTCSRDPVLGTTVSNLKTTRKNKTGGLLIVCIGADAPGKIELNPASLVAEADLLVADTRSQSIERGEFQKAADDGLIQPESIIPLGGLIQKTDLHRARGDLNDDRLIIFDSSGVALQDCVVASLVVATIRQKVLERSLT